MRHYYNDDLMVALPVKYKKDCFDIVISANIVKEIDTHEELADFGNDVPESVTVLVNAILDDDDDLTADAEQRELAYDTLHSAIDRELEELIYGGGI